jgi:uncharacterized membrane protein YdbT with pleckstrin-like domain
MRYFAEKEKFMTDEKLLFKGHPSPFINFGAFLLYGVLLIGGAVGAALVSAWLWVLAGVALVAMLIQWLVIRCRVYEVTTERLRLTTGILTRRTDEMELYRVQDVTLIEPLTARLLGLGTIRLATMDPSTPNLDLEYIRGARELREDLRKSIEVCRDRKRVRVAELE